MNQALHKVAGAISVPVPVGQPRSRRSHLERALLSVPCLVVLLSLVTAVLSHNAVFLLSYGSRYEVALSATGHDSRWTDAVSGVLAAAGVLGLVRPVRR